MQQDYFLNFSKYNYVKCKKPKYCILCAIRDKNPDVVDLTIEESENFIVSVNLYPYNPGHIMIFPKQHILDVRQLSIEEEQEMIHLQRRMLDLLDTHQNPEAYNIGYNMGKTAGASISHLHLHIIPRYPRELGIADLIAHKRVLIQSPFDTAKFLKEELAKKKES